MNVTAITCFGFVRQHVEDAASRRALSVADARDCAERVVAIGVPGGDDDDSVERLVERLLPRLDAVVLFEGFAFDRAARRRSRQALVEKLEAHRIPVLGVDEEAVALPYGASWREKSMSEVFRCVADALLDRTSAL